jgi:hypothetical protein
LRRRLDAGELAAIDPDRESPVLATTLPAGVLTEGTGLARVYGQRWSIETASEATKARGLERFMARARGAVDRLLRIVAPACTPAVPAWHDQRLTRPRQQASSLLRQLTTLGRRLILGKLAGALGLDYARHRRA